jgi:hypothetical protein
VSYDPNLKEPVTWQYVAGFVDGEGCISIKTAGLEKTGTSFDITVSQAKSNDAVLFEIQMFLEEHGIFTRIHTKARKNRNWDDCSYLTIRRVRDVYEFLVLCLPYLIVKREKALLVLREIEKKARSSDKPAVYSWLEGGE